MPTERDEPPERFANGHPIGADGLCRHERDFRDAAARRGLDADLVREVGWPEAERRTGRRGARYAK